MATRAQIETVLDGLDLPEWPVDGDCIPLSGLVRAALIRAGIASDVGYVTGWSKFLDQRVMVWLHMVALVGDTVVDVTARQFDRALPLYLILPTDEYTEVMARSTAVPEVTVMDHPLDRLERQVAEQRPKTAMPTSWRPMVDTPFWLAYDVTISSEGGPSGRKQYEIHLAGMPYANRPSLAAAKEAVESVYGAIEWKRVRLPKMDTEHYYYGPTTEFTSPATIWVADL